MRFVNKLSSEQIYQILGENGLVVLDDLPSLIEESNKENVESYYIRCGNFTKKEPTAFEMVRDYVYVKSGLAGLGLGEYADDKIDIYAMSDFSLHRIFGLDFPNERDFALQDSYVKFMANIFKKDGYAAAYNSYVSEMNKEKE